MQPLLRHVSKIQPLHVALILVCGILTYYLIVHSSGLPMSRLSQGALQKSVASASGQEYLPETKIVTLADIPNQIDGTGVTDERAKLAENTEMARSSAPLGSTNVNPKSTAGGTNTKNEKTASASATPQAVRKLALYKEPTDQPVGLTSQQQSDWQKLDGQPQAVWVGDWTPNISERVASYVSGAKATGTVPVLVVYNIPNRDCGSYSAGGVSGASAYKQWIDAIASSAKGSESMVLIEPDSLSQGQCLTPERYELLNYAVSRLSQAGLKTYLDAGHSSWNSVPDMAARLKQAGIANATGFSLNISNFRRTEDETAFGKQLSQAVSGKGFVIDTSRSGNGPATDGEWCNPQGRTTGTAPTLSTGDPLIHAYLWVKHPGESDGTCNGGPSAGTWWPAYAAGLIANKK